MRVLPSSVYTQQAKVAVVGGIPSEADLRAGSVFSGGGGDLARLLMEAGIPRNQCHLTLAYKERVAGGRVQSLVALTKKESTPEHIKWNGKMVLPSVVAEAEALRQELLTLKPNVVCAVGDLALFVLTGEWGVGNWRSSVMESTLIPGLKVIPTYSPSVLFTQSHLQPIIIHDLRRVARESAFPEIRRKKYNFLTRPTFEQAVASLNHILTLPGKIAADIETRAGHIASIGFAWSDTDAVCIPLMTKDSPEGYWTTEEEATLISLCLRILQTQKIIGQNWNYDEQYIYRFWHARCPDVEDTMIMQHSCFSNMEKGLGFLSSMYCDDHLYWKDELTGTDDDQDWEYNCKDTTRTYAIHTVLENVVKAMGMTEVNRFQQRLRVLALDAMIRGVRFDQSARVDLSFALQKEIADREAWILRTVGHPLNIRSPKQMAEFFYQEMGQAEIKKRNAQGGFSVTTDDEAMRKIAVREPILRPVTQKIMELRSLGVFHSTFVMAALDQDERLRCTYNVAGTDTYRFASSKNAFGTGLNLQNVPKGGETEGGGLMLPNVRKLFIPDPGKTVFDTDLDSADLRIVTWESDCAWMKKQFAAGNKPYIEVMKEYYQNPGMTKKSHPREYALFKSLCHGTNYLGTADGIAPRIGLDVEQTRKIQEWYFSMCPEIRKWQEDIKKQVTGRRYVENVFGYRMHFFKRIEGTIFNEAVAWIPQSAVACLINRVWEKIDQEIKEVEVLLQVHDSLVGQFDSVYGDWMLKKITDLANTVVLPYSDPLIIPMGAASSTKSWGECG